MDFKLLVMTTTGSGPSCDFKERKETAIDRQQDPKSSSYEKVKSQLWFMLCIEYSKAITTQVEGKTRGQA